MRTVGSCHRDRHYRSISVNYLLPKGERRLKHRLLHHYTVVMSSPWTQTGTEIQENTQEKKTKYVNMPQAPRFDQTKTMCQQQGKRKKELNQMGF